MALSKNDVGKLGKGLKSANLQSVLTRTCCLVAFMDQTYWFVFEQRQDFFQNLHRVVTLFLHISSYS